MATGGLVCDICGGKLFSDAAGEMFTCESCGMQYPKERIKKMYAEITGTVQVEGAVQVEGVASKESLYSRAMLFLEDGDFGQAQNYFNQVLDIDP
jgi:argininosuccinate synthase